jgi:uncharacterized protein (DUF1501 family)
VKPTRKDLVNILRRRELDKLNAEQAAAAAVLNKVSVPTDIPAKPPAAIKRARDAFLAQPHIVALFKAFKAAKLAAPKVEVVDYVRDKPGHIRVSLYVPKLEVELPVVLADAEKARLAKHEAACNRREAAHKLYDTQVARIQRRRSELHNGDVIETVVSSALVDTDSEMAQLLEKLSEAIETALDRAAAVDVTA